MEPQVQCRWDAQGRTLVPSLPDGLAGVPQVFRRCVAAGPGRPAIRDASESVSYGELDAASDAVAAAILERRTGPEPVPVALVAPHGWRAIAACLGVLKAGCFYVVLSGSDPQERLLEIGNAARPALVLSAGDLGSTARAACPGVPHLRVEEALTTAGTLRGRAPAPSAVVAMMFTSGSTGRPKGVLQAQRGMVYAAQRAVEEDRVGPGDRRTMLSPLGFAFSNWMVYAALLNGATLCLNDAARLGPTGVAAWLMSEGVTVLESSTALYRSLLAPSRPGARLPDSLRIVSTGLEPLTAEDVLRHRARTRAGCRLVNTLGSTEAMMITRIEAPAGPDPPAGSLAAGRPCDGVRVRIIDREGAAVSDGGAGEMVVSSPMLALGYWDDRAQTEARFGSGPDGRPSVRTGDLARLLADGRVELLGRVEERAKVRGYTVYLGEVEQALVAQPSVHSAAVRAEPNPRGDDRLAAFIVPRAGTAPTVRALRLGLADRLPAYMIPAVYRVLPALPHTARDKVDRRALAANAGEALPLSTPYAPPEGRIEEDLAALWAALLGVDRVGREDDFFELGGDSLLAAEMAAAVAEHTGLDLPLGRWAARPTVAGCVALLAATGEHAARDIVVAVQAGGTRIPLFCATGGTALQWYPLSARLGADQRLYVIEPRGMHTPGRPRRSVVGYAQDAAAAMRRVQPHGPYRLMGHSFGVFVAFEAARLLEAAGEEVDLLVLVDLPTPECLPRDQRRRTDRRLRRLLEPGGVLRAIAWRVDGVFQALALAGVLPLRPRARYDAYGRNAMRAGHRYRPADHRVPVRRTLVVQATSQPAGLPGDMGWGRRVQGALRAVRVPGAHHTLISDPSAEFLAALAAEGLGGAAAPATSAAGSR